MGTMRITKCFLIDSASLDSKYSSRPSNTCDPYGSPGWTRLVIKIVFFRPWSLKKLWSLVPKPANDGLVVKKWSSLYSKKHFISSSIAASSNLLTLPFESSPYRASFLTFWYFCLYAFFKIFGIWYKSFTSS